LWQDPVSPVAAVESPSQHACIHRMEDVSRCTDKSLPFCRSYKNVTFLPANKTQHRSALQAGTSRSCSLWLQRQKGLAALAQHQTTNKPSSCTGHPCTLSACHSGGLAPQAMTSVLSSDFSSPCLGSVAAFRNSRVQKSLRQPPPATVYL